MRVFYNDERPSYEEIVSYGPKWWTEYREMDANYRFAGWTLDLMAYWLERIINNQFPACADEQAISVFERVLQIEPQPGVTLEARRKTVAAYYSGTGHLSRSVILEMIKAYTGHDGEVFWSGQILCVLLNSNEMEFEAIKLLYKILERRKPAHIALMFHLLFMEIENKIIVDIARVRHRMLMDWYRDTGVLLNGKNFLDGTWQLGGIYVHPTRTRNRLEVMTQMQDDMQVTIKDHYWTLNGEFFLNGEKALRAEIWKEEL